MDPGPARSNQRKAHGWFIPEKRLIGLESMLFGGSAGTRHGAPLHEDAIVLGTFLPSLDRKPRRL